MARISDLLAAGTTLSFEFFPPKTPGGHLTLGRTVAALEPLRPDFVSITYGAGGSDRHRTGDVVEWMRTETEWEPMPHLTCYGHSRDDVTALLDLYREIGIENILALAGDPRADGQPEASDYRYAIELLEDVVAAGCFAAARRRPPAGPPAVARPRVRSPAPRRQAARRRLRDDAVLLRDRGIQPAASTSWRRSASTSRCCPASCRSRTSARSSGWPT